jgi:hypothetical protein
MAAPAAAAMAAPALAGAPAGVGAPALTAATKLIPTDAEVAPEPVLAAAGAAELAPDITGYVSPRPVTAAGGANGSSYDTVAPAPTAATTMPPAPPRIQIRQGATPPPGRRPTQPPRTQAPQPERPRRRGLAFVLIGLIVAGAVVAAVLLTNSGSGAKHPAGAGTQTTIASTGSRHRARTAQAPIQPSSVTVSVLNGTVQTGLAGRVSQKLTTDGFKAGRIETAADQTRQTTVVGYMPGYRRDALLVAKQLNLGPANVASADQSAQQVACPPPTACNANVIVTVGTDLASTQ